MIKRKKDSTLSLPGDFAGADDIMSPIVAVEIGRIVGAMPPVCVFCMHNCGCVCVSMCLCVWACVCLSVFAGADDILSPIVAVEIGHIGAMPPV